MIHSIGQISNFHRMFNKLIAFAVVCGLMVLLAGCGGGDLTPEEKAQHEKDMVELKNMTIQPVVCTNGVCK